MSRDSDFITETRIHVRAIWNAINSLKALQREYTALDYGNTLEPGNGENAGLGAVEVGAAIFDTTTALEALLAAGHATNLARLL